MFSTNPLAKFRQRWESLWRRRAQRSPSQAGELATSLAVETLEDRILLASPTAYEQYMLELVNLARRDPAAYASRLGIDLNEGLAAGTLSTAARQPLAFNTRLIDAAANHSQWMLDQGVFSHTGAGGSNPGQRMTAAGYVFSGSYTWGENIAWRGTSGTIDPTSVTRITAEALFVDSGIAGRGHRLNLLNDNFMEVGIGARTGRYSGMNAMMFSEDFAKTSSPGFFTGVVYNDGVTADRFYTPGEGLGGITITAVRDGGGQTFTTTTWASGGFSLGLPKGRYSILVEGPGLSSSQFMPVVLMGTKNRKFDFPNGQIRQAPEIALSGQGLALIHLDSTPRVEDGTHFGNVTLGSYGEHTYTIRNLGNAPLQFSGLQPIVITGANAADFSVTVQPPSEIAGGGTATFTVRFNPNAAGTRSARISLASNDSNENPFEFAISGQAVSGLVSGALLIRGGQAALASPTTLALQGPATALPDGPQSASLLGAADASAVATLLESTLPDGLGSQDLPATAWLTTWSPNAALELREGLLQQAAEHLGPFRRR